MTVAELNKMHNWSLSEALGVGRYDITQGYTNREVATAVMWADYEGSTWSQLRARNAKVLYRSVRRMGADTAPAKRLRMIGDHNVLVDCFLKDLSGAKKLSTEEAEESRELAVRKCLSRNSRKESQKMRWKETVTRLMMNENLTWRRQIITQGVAKTKRHVLLDLDNRIKNFGSGSTVFMSDTVSKRGLERTMSHVSTKVGTGAKVAARKVKGGRIRGMKVLAHMNTAGWGTMSRGEREAAVQCPCGGGMQNVEHIFSECEYMEECVDEMIATVGAAMQSENEEVQKRWLSAEGLAGKVRALVGMETRGVSPEVLVEMGSSLRDMVEKVEDRLCIVNEAGESWPMDILDTWASEGVSEQQIEAQSAVGVGEVSGGNQATEVG